MYQSFRNCPIRRVAPFADRRFVYFGLRLISSTALVGRPKYDVCCLEDDGTVFICVLRVVPTIPRRTFPFVYILDKRCRPSTPVHEPNHTGTVFETVIRWIRVYWYWVGTVFAAKKKN